MQTSSTKFTLFTLASMMIIVACSNNNGKLGITPKGTAGPVSNACVDSLKASEQKKVGGKRSVVVCQLPIGGSSSTAPTPVNHAVSYWVYGGDEATQKTSRSSNHVTLKMLVGLEETKPTIDKAKREAFAAIIGEDCGKPIAKIFENSHDNGIQLVLDLNFTVVDPTSNNDGIGEPTSSIPDDTLSITQMTSGADKFWQIDQLPTRPNFYATAKTVDQQSCEGDPVGKKTCIDGKRKASNVPFCAALAKRVGNTLGIVNAEGEKATCGAVQPEPLVSASPTPTPSPSATPSAAGAARVADVSSIDVEDTAFEVNEVGDLVRTSAAAAASKPGAGGDSSFAKPSGKDEDWLAKATLNHKDVVTIMSPVCNIQ